MRTALQRRSIDFLLTALAYGAAALLSDAFKMPGSNVSLVWLPTGVAVAAMWLRGAWLWVAVAATEAVVAGLEANGPFNIARVVAANTAAPLVVVLLLRRIRFDAALGRFRDAVALVTALASGGAAGAALNGLLRLGERGVTGDELQRMLNWWLGDVTGALVIAPAAFTWTARSAAPGGARRGELATLSVLLAIVPVLAFLAFPRGPVVLVSALYLAVPIQVWAAARLGPRGGTLSFVVVAGGVLLASLTTLSSPGVDPRESLILLDGFLIVSAATGLVVAALVAENTRAGAALAESHRLEAVRRLASGLAHDFNNLLTVIFGHVDLLRADAERSEVASDLDAIRAAAARAAAITQQLLAYGQDALLHPTRFEVNGLVEEVRTASCAEAPTGITVHLALAGALPAVHTDRDQLGRVLGHLCHRAIAAMGDRGILSIATAPGTVVRGARRAPGVEIRVADTGTALVSRGTGSVLEPYAGPLPTGDPGQRTSGLELAMADGFVRQVEGTIAVQSGFGAGTTVTITLPAEPAAA